VYFCGLKFWHIMEHKERNIIRDLYYSTNIDIDVLVKGWVRTKRGNKNVAFIA
jgi:asparaginyl-tRNA synthetase